MDRQAYTRLLHARIEHIEGALRRSLGPDYERVGGGHIEALRGHGSAIDAGGEDWTRQREDVERSLERLTTDVGAHAGTEGSTAAEAAEAIRDGAVELFRGEPSEILIKAKAILARLGETSAK